MFIGFVKPKDCATRETNQPVRHKLKPSHEHGELGACGTYVVTMTESQSMRADLVIQAGQVVVISGDQELAVGTSQPAAPAALRF